MKQALSRLVEGPLAEKILRGEVNNGDRLRVTCRARRLDFDQLTVIDPRMARRAVP
jgi:ATP-dependent Clp protease ATP-binding subunit ClpA